MIVLSVSKWVGDLFEVSLYNLYIRFQDVPYVDVEPPRKYINLSAKDIMVKPVVCFKEIERIDNILNVLNQTYKNFNIENIMVFQ